MAVVWEIRMDSEGRGRLQRRYTREQQRRLRGLCWPATLVECSRLLPRAGDGGKTNTLGGKSITLVLRQGPMSPGWPPYNLTNFL